MDNFLVNSFRNGIFNITLIDPLFSSSDVSFLPSVAKRKKRNKRQEVESKGRAYSSKGHPKRRKNK